MKDFFKYLTASEDDINWGLFLNVTGISVVEPFSSYPSPEHPKNYYFNWENGRTLNEFQVNYITEGSGILETKQGKFRINPGSVLILFPGMWHRYKPDSKTGWTEHYIGFNGEFTRHLFRQPLFTTNNPVIKVGFHESLLYEFNQIIQLVKEERPGFQHECAGKLVYILGRIVSLSKNSEFANREMERTIRRACLYLRDHVHHYTNIEELAAQLHVSYSYFRRMFKKYTGLSPYQYQLGLRIQQSKEMIRNSSKSIKEIAIEMGFESIHYFSRIYKEKEGVSPSQLRKKKTSARSIQGKSAGK
ncbi:MAG TPA: AraC family transcriptional regulator [Prolixibacteraceae bacterium]|nr:AraC family transcriptional regulator [Prolixibacteraceae bacterium]